MVNAEKERIVFEEVVRTLDKHENESLPQVKLSSTEVSVLNLAVVSTAFCLLALRVCEFGCFAAKERLNLF